MQIALAASLLLVLSCCNMAAGSTGLIRDSVRYQAKQYTSLGCPEMGICKDAYQVIEPGHFIAWCGWCCSGCISYDVQATEPKGELISVDVMKIAELDAWSQTSFHPNTRLNFSNYAELKCTNQTLCQRYYNRLSTLDTYCVVITGAYLPPGYTGGSTTGGNNGGSTDNGGGLNAGDLGGGSGNTGGTDNIGNAGNTGNSGDTGNTGSSGTNGGNTTGSPPAPTNDTSSWWNRRRLLTSLLKDNSRQLLQTSDGRNVTVRFKVRSDCQAAYKGSAVAAAPVKILSMAAVAVVTAILLAGLGL